MNIADILPPEPEPAWLAIARAEVGVHELPGKAHSTRVLEYLSVCSLLSRLMRLVDETPWCSAFVNFCLMGSGMAITRSAMARSWIKAGTPLESPKVGAVCVLTRKSATPGSGHVGFVVAWDAHRVCMLGGNQGNKVCEAWYPRSRVVAYRWPSPRTN